MTTEIRIVNKGSFFNQMEKRLTKIPEANMKRACQRAADVVRNEAVNSIAAGAKTGATTTRYNPRRTHTASAAGEPPASDTGFLVNSITATVGKDGKFIVGDVKASAPYAAHLEFGTTKMSARPFFQPALQKSEEKITRIFKQEGVIK
tara:strand:+ start:222 stop:665 length:444 start_codon:yes stop_codon:yes gene_type:complete